MVKLAIVGATGLVGQTLIDEISRRQESLSLKLLASERSAGQRVEFRGQAIAIEGLSSESFCGVDYALFALDSELAREYIPRALDCGCVVIDNSSAFRMDPTVPLVVPEVNPEALYGHRGLIANPNCSTIQSVVPLAGLKKFGLKRIIYTTYQSVSGSGQAGLEDLRRGLSGEAAEFYPVSIAGNVIPQIDRFLADGYTGEEVKMIEETRKILGLPNLSVTATTVRVPVEYGHSVSMIVQTEKAFQLREIHEALRETPGLVLFEGSDYPTPLAVRGREDILVGRVRRDDSAENSLHLWCVADNIRKGAAGNAAQILDILLQKDHDKQAFPGESTFYPWSDDMESGRRYKLFEQA